MKNNILIFIVAIVSFMLGVAFPDLKVSVRVEPLKADTSVARCDSNDSVTICAQSSDRFGPDALK